MTQQKKNRREFIQATASAAVLVGTGAQSVLAQQKQVSGGIPTRPLGKTGVQVSILSLGGWHIGSVEGGEAIRIMHAAIDNGMTFFDKSGIKFGFSSGQIRAVTDPVFDQSRAS